MKIVLIGANGTIGELVHAAAAAGATSMILHAHLAAERFMTQRALSRQDGAKDESSTR